MTTPRQDPSSADGGIDHAREEVLEGIAESDLDAAQIARRWDSQPLLLAQAERTSLALQSIPQGYTYSPPVGLRDEVRAAIAVARGEQPAARSIGN